MYYLFGGSVQCRNRLCKQHRIFDASTGVRPAAQSVSPSLPSQSRTVSTPPLSPVALLVHVLKQQREQSAGQGRAGQGAGNLSKSAQLTAQMC